MITIVKPNKDLRRNQVQPTYADRIYSLALRTAMLIALLYMQSNQTIMRMIWPLVVGFIPIQQGFVPGCDTIVWYWLKSSDYSQHLHVNPSKTIIKPCQKRWQQNWSCLGPVSI